MRKTPLVVAAVATFLVLIAAAAAVPAGAQTSRPPEGIVIGSPKPLPILSGPPGAPSPFPCDLEGRLLDGVFEPTRGDLKAAMLFVDFSDNEGDPADLQSLYDGFVPETVAALGTLSRGALDFTVTPHLKWLRMAGTFDETGLAGGAAPFYDRHHPFIAKAIRAADPEFDFTGITTVYVVTPPAQEMRSAADQGNSGPGFMTDEGEVRAAATLGTSDAYYRGFKVLLHETGHLLGLEDLYPYSADVSSFIGPWDIMGALDGPHLPMTAFIRLQAGWLDKRDFTCARKTTRATLTPVAGQALPDVLAVRTGRDEAIVIEARTDQVGMNCEKRGGVLVYSASVSRSHGEGPLRVVDADPDDVSCGDKYSGAEFVPGTAKAAYTDPDGRLAIEVLGRKADGFEVEVTILDTACAVPNVLGRTVTAARKRLVDAGCAPGKVSGAKRGKRKVTDQSEAPGTTLPGRARIGLTVRRKGG